LALALGLATGRAETTNLFPIADTAIFAVSPDNNLGAMDFMPVGTTSLGLAGRGLIKFDLAGAIPAGAVVTNVTLNLGTVFAQGVGRSFALHRMLVSWNEGTGTGGGGHSGSLGSAANATEATWNRRAHPSATWGTPGAIAGTDFVTGNSATATLGAAAMTFASAQMVADVNLWAASGSTNFGWLLKIVDESPFTTASRIATREDALNRPVLTVHYSMPMAPTPPNIFGVAKINNQIRFSFNGQAAQSYSVDSRTNLATGWTVLTNYTALPANTTLHFTNAITGEAKYYRVRSP